MRSALAERAATANPPLLIRPFQSLGSLVQFPEGQSSAPIAEHWPAQLSPPPQVTFLASPVSGKQHVTFGFSSAEVRVSSTKSISSLAEAISSATTDEGDVVAVEVVVVVVVVVVVFVGEVEVVVEVVVLVLVGVVELVVDKLVSEY